MHVFHDVRTFKNLRKPPNGSGTAIYEYEARPTPGVLSHSGKVNGLPITIPPPANTLYQLPLAQFFQVVLDGSSA